MIRCLQVACWEGRRLPLRRPRQPPCRKPAPFPPPPALSQTRWGRCRLIAHLSSTPELINSGSDFGTLPPVAPTSGWSPEERGGEGLGKARAVGGCALTFALIPVSVSSCRSRHCLASGPRQPPPHACQGPGERGQLQSHEVGRARLSARYAVAESIWLRYRVSQTSAGAFRKTDGRQGDQSRRPHREPPGRLQRRAPLWALRSHPPSQPCPACVRSQETSSGVFAEAHRPPGMPTAEAFTELRLEQLFGEQSGFYGCQPAPPRGSRSSLTGREQRASLRLVHKMVLARSHPPTSPLGESDSHPVNSQPKSPRLENEVVDSSPDPFDKYGGVAVCLVSWLRRSHPCLPRWPPGRRRTTPPGRTTTKKRPWPPKAGRPPTARGDAKAGSRAPWPTRPTARRP